MRIRDVRTVLLTGPATDDPFLQACRERRSAAFVEIYADGLDVGVGETYAGYFFPEGIAEIVEFFRPVLIGQSVDDADAIDRLWQRMYHCGNFWCRVGLGLSVLNGIEAALWDMLGKRLNLPVCQLLGGPRHERLPAYASGGPSNYPLSTLAKKVEYYLSLGFNGVKLAAGAFTRDESFTISAAPQEAADLEAEKLRFLRDRFGNSLQLMLDGHMGNSPSQTWDLAAAQAVLRAVEPFDLLFFEEPLHYTEPGSYAELCRTSNVPIAGGECLTGVAEWQTFIQRDCFDVGQPDASYTGGLTTFMEVAQMLADRGKRVATHSWGAGGSLMQNVHCGFAAANTMILEIPPDFGPLHRELLGDSFQMHDGHVMPPTAPGLGVVLTDEIKARFPFQPGSGEFNSVPGKVMPEEIGGEHDASPY